MARERTDAVRVGVLILAALGVAALGILLIGDKNNLFSRKNRYYARFASVSGLGEGSTVQLNGVKVGTVKRIVLPEDPKESLITVDLSLDRRFADRVRGDSTAAIKTLGLLGDKYLEISSGSLAQDVIPSGAEIPAAPPGAVDAMMASGEDVMANVTEISASLKSILTRMERGEGLLGQLISDPTTGQRISDQLVATLDSVQRVARRVENGEGAIPRLITDQKLADRLTDSLEKLNLVVTRVEAGKGLAPALISDEGPRQDFEATLASLKSTATSLAEFSDQLKAANGLLPRLLFDQAYADRVATQIETTAGRVERLTAELESGNGTAAKLIHDPEVYLAIEDILVGVNESRMLRWLIRNRQKAGIAKRYAEAQKSAIDLDAPPPPAPEPPPR